MSHKEPFDLCVGNITIITSNNLVLTGQLIDDERPTKAGTPGDEAAVRCDDTDRFITLKLSSPLLIIPGNGGEAQEQPFYVEGDRVRIKIAQIVTVGPSHV